MISDTPSLELEFDFEGQMPVKELCYRYKLMREASYRLRPFSYACRRNFRTISRTPSFDLEFNLEGQMPGKKVLAV